MRSMNKSRKAEAEQKKNSQTFSQKDIAVSISSKRGMLVILILESRDPNNENAT